VSLLALLIELLRRSVAHARVPSLPVLTLLDELFDVRAQRLWNVLPVPADSLSLPCLYEAFANRMAVRVRGTTRARNDAVLPSAACSRFRQSLDFAESKRVASRCGFP